MKISVDNEKCDAHGMCTFSNPALFTLDDGGYSNIGQHREVPPGAEDTALAAVNMCPEQALSIDT